MEFLFEYIKRNTKYAAKNVFLKFKEYIPFFAAIFIIECVFFTIFVTTASNTRNISEELGSKFNYDIVVSGLTEAQSTSLQNSLYYPSFTKDRAFDKFWIKQAPENEGGDHRFYVNMREDKDHKAFIAQYITPYVTSSDNVVTVDLSPLYQYKISSNMLSESPNILLVIAMCLISTIAVAAIYSVRLNNQKFMYAVYMTFGADLKKLISTAVFEMMLIGVICFIPSALLTYLFAYLAYKPFGVAVVFEAKMVLNVLINILVISIAGVYFPMKITSRKPPIELIVSSDNSNHVISPRRSVNLLGKKYPRHYETLSFFRFRKYYLKLILSSVIFTSIFICGFYISDMYQLNAQKNIEEYTVMVNTKSLSAEEQADDMEFLYGHISGIDGVNGILWNVDAPATELNSFAIISKDSQYRSGGLVTTTAKVDCLSDEMRAAYDSFADNKLSTVTNSFKYSSLDSSMLDFIDKNYETEGDIYSILTNENTVIVSENIYNERRFKFNVGDTIVVSTQLDVLKSFDGDYFDTVGVLNHLVKNTYREFKVYTVGAVIKDYPDSSGTFTLGMNRNEYQAITGRNPLPSSAKIYIDASLESEKIDNINDEMNYIFSHMGSSYRLHRSFESVNRQIAKEKNHTLFAVILSSLVLIMSPVVWFFSQVSFFGKRRKELFVLRAFGAEEKKVSRMFSHSGTILSFLGFVVATVMSIPASYIIYMAFNTWLPSLALVQNDVLYKFYISPIALITCAVISAASGYFASMIPYKLSVRKKKTKLNEANNYEGDEN